MKTGTTQILAVIAEWLVVTLRLADITPPHPQQHSQSRSLWRGWDLIQGLERLSLPAKSQRLA
jgi:hypothetical protein